MCALESWHHYLEGAKLQFEIWTDHQNLQYFMEAKKLNQMTGTMGTVSIKI